MSFQGTAIPTLTMRLHSEVQVLFGKAFHRKKNHEETQAGTKNACADQPNGWIGWIKSRVRAGLRRLKSINGGPNQHLCEDERVQ